MFFSTFCFLCGRPLLNGVGEVEDWPCDCSTGGPMINFVFFDDGSYAVLPKEDEDHRASTFLSRFGYTADEVSFNSLIRRYNGTAPVGPNVSRGELAWIILDKLLDGESGDPSGISGSVLDFYNAACCEIRCSASRLHPDRWERKRLYRYFMRCGRILLHIEESIDIDDLYSWGWASEALEDAFFESFPELCEDNLLKE